MSRKGFCRGILFLVLAAALGPLAWGSPEVSRTYVDGPIVLGDQLHAGGEIRVERVGSGQLLAIRINGRPVALVFSGTCWHRQTTGKSRLCLARDDRGYYFFAVRSRKGLTRQGGEPPSVLQLAVVGRGLSTVTPPWFGGEGVARKNR